MSKEKPLALFDSDIWKNTSRDLCSDGWPAAVLLINQEARNAKEYIERLEAAHIKALRELHNYFLHGSYPSIDLEYNEQQFVESEMAKLRGEK